MNSSFSASKNFVPVPALARSRDARIAGNRLSGRSYVGRALLSLAGFAAAAAVSLIFPDVLEGDDTVYRFILAGLIVLYFTVAVASWFGEGRRARFVGRAPFRFAMGVTLAAWDLLGAKLGILPLPFFPGPSKVADAFREDFVFLIENTVYSLRLFAFGFVIGVVLGVGTGILIGWFAKVNYWVFPILKFTGVVPAVAWMPFALTVLPTSFLAGVFMIAICAWFPVAFMTARGMAATQRIYFEVAKTLGAKQGYLLFHVALPNAVPQIFTGISTANGLAFTTLVVSEMLGAKGGLGYYINWAKAWSSYYKVYAAIVIMAVLFSLIMKGIALIQKRLLIWQEGIVK